MFLETTYVVAMISFINSSNNYFSNSHGFLVFGMLFRFFLDKVYIISSNCYPIDNVIIKFLLVTMFPHTIKTLLMSSEANKKIKISL
jgi:hypothetical protein